MRRSALIIGSCAALGAPGCFFTDPINQRPSISINQSGASIVYRGDQVQLQALTDDPDHQGVSVAWSAFACTDATATNGCDTVPFVESKNPQLAFAVPSNYVEPTTHQTAPVESLLVLLNAVDDYGAVARPGQQLVIPVADHAPSLTVRVVPRYGNVIDTPIDVFAKVTDPDDDPTSAIPTEPFEVFTPSANPAYEKTELVLPIDPTDPHSRQFSATIVAHGLGDWTVRAHVVDPVGQTDTKDVTLTVVPDHAPCLAQWSPIVPTGTAVLPITEDTLFQIPVVADDLDPYPTIANDAVFGATTFQWSILPPGATAWQPLAGATGNSASLAHDAYAAGSVVQMRVEIQDRTHTALTCAATEPTCSVISDTACIQRQTWRVELH